MDLSKEQEDLQSLKVEINEFVSFRSSNLPSNMIAYRKKNQTKKSSLKSDLKKSNTFVKKLRSINSEGIIQCIRDVETLNLSLFITEIVSAIVATTYKPIDTSNMVKLCVSLHQIYEEFNDHLGSNLKQALLLSISEDDTEASKRKRIQIRFIVELFQVGLFADDEFFVHLLRNLLGKLPLKGLQGGVSVSSNKPPPLDLLGLGTLVKYGSEVLFGYQPRKVVELAARLNKPIVSMPSKQLSSAKVKDELCGLINQSYDSFVTELVHIHKLFRAKESRIEKDKLIHGGSLSEARLVELEQAKKQYDKYLSIVTILSDSMGEQMPLLEIEKEEEEDSSRSLLTVWEGSKQPEEADVDTRGGLYDDLEARVFYEDLPDLLSLVPLTVLGLSPEQVTMLREKWDKEKQDFLSQLAGPSTTSDDLGGGGASLATTPSLKDLEETVLKSDDDGNEEGGSLDATIANEPADNEDGVNMDESKTIKLATLLDEKLPECVSKQRADEFCISFCHISTKNARKRLIQSLMRLPRSRSELAPTYSRIVASLSRIYPELVQPILDGLNKDFFGILKAKHQLHIESKVKNVRYVGELIKFRVAPPIMALRMFKSLLNDFSNHNVQLLAVLLETCGRFLYVLPYTHDRIEEVLTDMIRIRRSRNLDLHQQNVLEAAYFAVKPPDRLSKVVKKQLSVVQQYARYLILEQLDERKNADIDAVIKSLRRLPWKDEQEQVTHHVIKASLKIARTKYTTIPNLADCLSGLAAYQPCLLTILVDRILEEVQRAIETPFKREMQRMIGFIRLLGELYNYTAISSIIIFDLLHHLINFGHEDVTYSNDANQLLSLAPQSTSASSLVPSSSSSQQKRRFDPRILSDTDPLNDLFRAQLVCELLNTCGIYYVRGKSKDQLARFLVYFQRYLLTKQFIPLHVEFTILDTMDYLEDLAKEALKETMLKASKATNVPMMVDNASTLTGGWIFPRFDHFDKAQAVIQGYEELSMNQLDSGDNDGEDMNNDHEVYRDDDDEEDEDDEEGDGEEENKAESDNEGDDNNNNNYNEDDEQLRNQQAQDDLDELLEQEQLSELHAKQMMEKMRVLEEDDEFDQAFRAVMLDSVSSINAVHASSKNNLDKMVIPAILPKPKNTFRLQNDDDDRLDNQQGKGNQEVAFKLLSRDVKGRFETRQMLVPSGNRMAVKLVAAEEELKLERQRLKEKVLQIEQLSAEAENNSDDDESRYFGRREAYSKPTSSSHYHTTATTNTTNNNSQASSTSTSSSTSSIVPTNTVSGTAYIGYNRQPNRSGYHNRRHLPVKVDETHKSNNTLNLDEFLAESSAAEIRRMQSTTK